MNYLDLVNDEYKIIISSYDELIGKLNALLFLETNEDIKNDVIESINNLKELRLSLIAPSVVKTFNVNYKLVYDKIIVILKLLDDPISSYIKRVGLYVNPRTMNTTKPFSVIVTTHDNLDTSQFTSIKMNILNILRMYCDVVDDSKFVAGNYPSIRLLKIDDNGLVQYDPDNSTGDMNIPSNPNHDCDCDHHICPPQVLEIPTQVPNLSVLFSIMNPPVGTKVYVFSQGKIYMFNEHGTWEPEKLPESVNSISELQSLTTMEVGSIVFVKAIEKYYIYTSSLTWEVYHNGEVVPTEVQFGTELELYTKVANEGCIIRVQENDAEYKLINGTWKIINIRVSSMEQLNSYKDFVSNGFIGIVKDVKTVAAYNKSPISMYTQLNDTVTIEFGKVDEEITEDIELFKCGEILVARLTIDKDIIINDSVIGNVKDASLDWTPSNLNCTVSSLTDNEIIYEVMIKVPVYETEDVFYIKRDGSWELLE